MKREIIVTSDGSTTIHLPNWNEQYHSKHGAIQEAYHVFIKNGLSCISHKEVSILEMGFGTGLNAFITFLESIKNSCNIHYVGIEGYPVSMDEINQLNYISQLEAKHFRSQFLLMHNSTWEETHTISENFQLTKRQQFFEDFSDVNSYDLIYFDAFGARVQPHLWTEKIFSSLYRSLKKGGILVTYAAKGSVRRAMQAVGFKVERLPGPPGKREMLRAIKLT